MYHTRYTGAVPLRQLHDRVRHVEMISTLRSRYIGQEQRGPARRRANDIGRRCSVRNADRRLLLELSGGR
jgi:hypothetical protein